MSTTDGDSMATDSQAPSAFEQEYEHEDDSIMSRSFHMNGTEITDRSIRSIDSSDYETSFEKDSSMQRLVDNIDDVHNRFSIFLNSQTSDSRMSTNSQGTAQTTDVSSLQDELNAARLTSPTASSGTQSLQQELNNGAQIMGSPSYPPPAAAPPPPTNNNSVMVETVDEASCHETGIQHANMRKLPSAGPSILGNIQEEEGEEHEEEPSSSSNSRQRQRPPKQSPREEEPALAVETVDEDSCHESGVFDSERTDRRRAHDSISSKLTGVSEGEHHQEEFDPSFYKKREPATSPDETTSSRSLGGFGDPAGMGGAPSTEPEWNNLQNTLDEETDQVKNAPYYNTPPGGGERPTSPTGNNYENDPNTDDLRRELDGAALQPPNVAHPNSSNHDVEAQQQRTNGGYWQGDKSYDERYDDEVLDDSLKGGGGGAPVQAQWVNNGGNNGAGKMTESKAEKFKRELTYIVGNDERYQLMIKGLGGCIVCMALWTLIMIIVLAAK